MISGNAEGPITTGGSGVLRALSRPFEPRGQPCKSLLSVSHRLWDAPAGMGVHNRGHLVLGSSPQKGAVASSYQLQKRAGLMKRECITVAVAAHSLYHSGLLASHIKLTPSRYSCSKTPWS